MRHPVPRGLLTGAGALAAVVMLAGCTSWQPGSDLIGQPVPSLTAPAAVPRPPEIVAIGDSIMSGNGLWPSEAWPAVLARAGGWGLENLAEDGAGFVQTGDDGGTLAAQVAEAESSSTPPALILVSASSNDLGIDPASVGRAANEAFASLRSAFPDVPIVGLSAIWGDEPVPADLAAINDEVQEAATAEGADWIDVGDPLDGRFDLMQIDDTHPTADGQRALAADVGDRLKSLLGL